MKLQSKMNISHETFAKFDERTLEQDLGEKVSQVVSSRDVLWKANLGVANEFDPVLTNINVFHASFETRVGHEGLCHCTVCVDNNRHWKVADLHFIAHMIHVEEFENAICHGGSFSFSYR